MARRFKLKVGFHTEKDRSKPNDPPIIYKPGSVITTDVDLVQKFGRDKFVELSPRTRQPEPEYEESEELENQVDDEAEFESETDPTDEPVVVDTPKPAAKPTRRRVR